MPPFLTCGLGEVGVVRMGRFRPKLVRHVGAFSVAEAKATALPEAHQDPVILGPSAVLIRL